jgi:glycosyltransferase involved in cell wall biosynthesis
MEILLFQKLIPYYRIEIFRQLMLRYNVIVCHGKGLNGSTNKSFHNILDFRTEIIPTFYYRKEETTLIQNIFPVINRYKPKIIISEYSVKYLTFWLVFLFRRIFRYKLIVWTHGINNHELENPFGNFRGRISLKVFEKADAIILYSDNRGDLLKKFIDPEKIFIAHNTIDLSKNLQIYSELQIGGKRELRAHLGFREKYHLVYSGRLIAEKRIDLMISVFSLLKENLDISLHVIGGGPEIEKLKTAQKNIGNIYLHGVIYNEEEAGKIIYASDIMINTGYVGLSILHSFSLGIPFAAFRSQNNYPAHSPEIENLEDGINGILCEFDIGDMSKRITSILVNPDVLSSMQVKAIEKARSCSVDRMVAGFQNALNYCGYKS